MPLSKIKPSQYDTLLTEKADSITEKFQCFGDFFLEVFPSIPLNFRMRTEFRVWHNNDRSDYVMFAKGAPKTPVTITEFPIASKRINELMPALMEKVNKNDTLKHRLFQIEFLTTLKGEALITMIYHKKLDEAWQEIAQTLQQDLDVAIIGRSKKQKLTLKQDYVTEYLNINGQKYSFKQVEGSFTQPNAYISTKMIEWVLGNVSNETNNDLLELYCGNGNFTIPLASCFNNVLATEISKTSVHAAHHNLNENRVSNTKIARLSSEEFVQAFDNVREFRRLKEQEIVINSYNFSTILVDPPRAGLDDTTTRLAARFDKIIYISCNPTTLFENLKSLCKTHAIEQFALFDQFPYTDHIESGVILKRIR